MSVYEVAVASSDYLSLTLRINELEGIVAELKKDNGEKAKIITDQTSAQKYK